jgi:hypothetical protein
LDVRVIRNRYTFSRPLSSSEANLLLVLIGWRKGSCVITDGLPVIGCVAHPDDLAAFRKELRKRRAPKLLVTLRRDIEKPVITLRPLAINGHPDPGIKVAFSPCRA